MRYINLRLTYLLTYLLTKHSRLFNFILYVLNNRHRKKHINTYTGTLPPLSAIFQVNLGWPEFIEAKDDGSVGDNWSYNKSCKAPVKSSPPTNHHPVFLQPDVLPVTQPTVSEHRMKKKITFHELAHPKLTWGSYNFVSDH